MEKMPKISIIFELCTFLTLGVQRHSGKSPSSGDPVYRIGQVGDESAASHRSKYTVNFPTVNFY